MADIGTATVDLPSDGCLSEVGSPYATPDGSSLALATTPGSVGTGTISDSRSLNSVESSFSRDGSNCSSSLDRGGVISAAAAPFCSPVSVWSF